MPLAIALIALTQIEPIKPLLGADEVLRRISVTRSKGEAQPVFQADDSEFIGGRKRWLAFEGALKELKQSGQTLDRHAAAQKWLAALDDAISLNVSPTRVIEVMPPMASWPEIQAGIGARFSKRRTEKAASLMLFGSLLSKDGSAHRAALESAYEATDSAGGAGMPAARRSLAEVGIILAGASQDRNLLKKSLLKAGQSKEKLYITEDQLDLLGSEKRSFLVQLFRQSNAPLSLYHSLETPNSRLVHQIAISTAPFHSAPQWALAEERGQQTLYEAVAKRFNPFESWPPKREESEDYFPDPSAPDKRGVLARTYYLFTLAKSGQIDRALSGAGDGTCLLYEWGLFQWERPNTNTLEFLRRLLRSHPKAAWWKEYEEQALAVGRFGGLLETANTALTHKGLKNWHLSAILHAKESALLAEDRVTEALQVIRRRAVCEAKSESDTSPDSAASRMERLAKALRNSAMESEAASLARRKGYSSGPDSSESGLAEREALVAKMAFMPYGDSLGAELISIYHHAHRPKDVIKIAEAEGIWTESDMSEIDLDRVRYSWAGTELPTSVQLGMALVKVGRVQEAYPIAKSYVTHDLSNDAAYEFLLSCESPNVLADLEALAALNPYEERPLIWKAKKLLQLGQLNEAEQAIRAAIANDPSDGDQPHGRRMHAYTVLADILDKKGDPGQASLYRKAVKAIRRAERADDMLEAGLVNRAIKEYDLALTDFADAYCIQSRLAINLAKAGRMKEAIVHYRRAYELMADSFGFVETHCFGCEEAFSGDVQQNLAEEVFTQIAKERPTKPQIHYLLGYLRNAQGRPQEAIPHFKRAVELDARYLNAWKRLAEIGKGIIPSDELKAVEAKVTQLEPHKAASISEQNYWISECQSFTEACLLAENMKRLPQPSLFKLKEAKGISAAITGGASRFMIDDSAPLTPGRAIARTALFNALLPLLD